MSSWRSDRVVSKAPNKQGGRELYSRPPFIHRSAPGIADPFRAQGLLRRRALV
jgi:hypothetical protein